MSEFLEIDGSVLEGGGQILRNAISLSTILGIPVRVTNIRAGRSRQGLAMQHITGIELVAQMCLAKMKGVRFGSKEIEFTPGKLHCGYFEGNTRSAGSVSLLLQVALPCALVSEGPVTLVLRGGTNADLAPQIDYMTEIFFHNFKRFGAGFQLSILKRGYFPKGGGIVKVTVDPVRQFKNVNVTERGSVSLVVGWAYVAGLINIKEAEIMAEAAKQELRGHPKVRIEAYSEHNNVVVDKGTGILVLSETTTRCVLGAGGVGKPGVESREVGAAAGRALQAELLSGACVDSYMQDQLIIYMALAAGRSVLRVGEVTLHTKTAIHVAELFTKVKFTIQPDGDTNLIECTGIGFTNESVPAKE